MAITEGSKETGCSCPTIVHRKLANDPPCDLYGVGDPGISYANQGGLLARVCNEAGAR